MTRALACVLVLSAAACSAPSAEPARVARLRDALAEVRFVAYSPRRFSIDPERPAETPRAEIEGELALLRPYFDGLVTYASVRGLERVAEIAAAQAYRAVVIGVWEPRDAAELARAVAVARAHPDLVVGLAIGNEGIAAGRYTAADVVPVLERVRRELPDVAVSTSEPFGLYLAADAQAWLAAQDFLLPNVHPTSESWFAAERPETAPAFVEGAVEELARRTQRPILVKETGLPSEPAERGFTPDRQAAFWRDLAARIPPSRERAFAAFAAFDCDWLPAALEAQFGSRRPEDAHWGLFDAAGRPKPAADVFLPRR